MRWLVLVSPMSEARVSEALSSVPVEAEVSLFETEEDIRTAVSRESDDGGGHFVAVGDDSIAGVVLDALMRLARREPPVLGILPGEGGNDFARTFGLPQPMEDAVAHLAGDETYECDVGLLEGSWGRRYFLNSASAGVTVSRASSPRTGFRLATERRTYEGTASGVLVANGQFAGGGWRVAPRATVTDVALDVQIWDIRRRNRTRFLELAASGGHLKDPRVRRVSAAMLELATDKPWPVTADGIQIGQTPLTGRAVPAAISIKI